MGRGIKNPEYSPASSNVGAASGREGFCSYQLFIDAGMT